MKLLRKIVGYGTIVAGLTGITAGLVYGPEELKREITSNGLVRVARAARTVCTYASIFEFIETFIYLFFHFQSTKQSVMALPRSLVSANTLLRYFHHESFYMLCIPGVHVILTGERVEMSCSAFNPFPWDVVTYSKKCTSCCCLIKGWEEGSFFSNRASNTIIRSAILRALNNVQPPQDQRGGCMLLIAMATFSP